MPQGLQPFDGVDGRRELVALGADEDRDWGPARLLRPGMEHEDTSAQDEVVFDRGPEVAGEVCGAAFRPPRRKHDCSFRVRQETSTFDASDHPDTENLELVDVG